MRNADYYYTKKLWLGVLYSGVVPIVIYNSVTDSYYEISPSLCKKDISMLILGLVFVLCSAVCALPLSLVTGSADLLLIAFSEQLKPSSMRAKPAVCVITNEICCWEHYRPHEAIKKAQAMTTAAPISLRPETESCLLVHDKPSTAPPKRVTFGSIRS